jgi:hypothetical protein
MILFEMLTGRYPYPVTGSMVEVVRHITETEPDRPSTIHRGINNEIETIILRSLAKDRERRYPSADALGADVQRWLDGDPIEAKRDSAIYVLRKMATRYYFHTSVIAALVAAMIGFGGIAFHTLLREREAASQLRTINQQYVAHEGELADRIAEARVKQEEHLLGWFLLEWHAGRVESARSIQARLRTKSPEYAVMQFLLDDWRTVEELRSRLPAGADSLVLFATGERHLKAGRIEEAKAAFRRYFDLYKDPWTPLVEARLSQLEARRSEGRAGG